MIWAPKQPDKPKRIILFFILIPVVLVSIVQVILVFAVSIYLRVRKELAFASHEIRK